MALDQFGAEVFFLLKRHGLPLDRLLTFGRQHLAIDPDHPGNTPELARILREPDGSEGRVAAGPFADRFFEAIGAGTVDSLDASDYEACTRIHDLNEPVPESWHGEYDVVFDGGTLEHVFHLPNAIANAMNLVKPHGLIVTQSPSNNLNGHGFYQFSPELFFRLFDQANGFRLILIALVESDPPGRLFRVEDPECLGRRVTFGGQGPLQLIAVAQRETHETIRLGSPYQSDYSASWKKAGTNESGTATDPNFAGARVRLRDWLPARWVKRYQLFRHGRRRQRLSRTGVDRVDSLEACLRVDDLSRPRPKPAGLASEPAR